MVKLVNCYLVTVTKATRLCRGTRTGLSTLSGRAARAHTYDVEHAEGQADGQDDPRTLVSSSKSSQRSIDHYPVGMQYLKRNGGITTATSHEPDPVGTLRSTARFTIS